MLHTRPVERQTLKQLLQSGTSILMLAPRRVGKTWLMKKLAEDLTAEGWTCVYFDASGINTQSEFLRRLCEKISAKQDLHTSVLSHVSQRFRQLTGGSPDGTLIQAIGKVDPDIFIETLVEALNKTEMKSFIMIDEISLFVLELSKADTSDGKIKTKSFLYNLRRLQQGTPNVCWLMTGSIGLDIVANDLGVQGALIDLKIFPLEPFDAAAARSFMSSPQLARPILFTIASFEHFQREIGWLAPYYLKHVGDFIRPTGRDGDLQVATEADIDLAISTILQPTYRAYFATWREHIVKNFKPQDSDILSQILSNLCETPTGETEVTILTHVGKPTENTPRRIRDLLLALQSDGFLIKIENRWLFRSPLLRRYWSEYVK